MKNRTIKTIGFVLVLVFTLILTGCYTPSPLYGTWSDNKGNSIRFQTDNSFSAKIKATSGTESYEGTFTVLDNVLVFEIENPSYNVVSEWDVRGAMLYITWVTSTSETVNITLYHTER